MKVIDNGTVTNPKGYKGTGLHIGIKKKNKDFALIVSDVEAKAVGTFTTNMVKAAPVLWDKHIVHNFLRYVYPIKQGLLLPYLL